MLVTRQEMVNEVLSKLGTTSTNIDATDLTSVQLRINQVQDFIFFDRDWEWRKRTYYMTTQKPYSTGSVTVTENSRSVSGSGTVWTSAMKTGYLLVNGYSYKIRSVTNGTTLLLEAPYPGSTESSKDYQIIFPNYHLPHEIEGIISVKLAGCYIDVKTRDQLCLGLDSVASPQECAFGDRASEDYYNDGTVTVTNGSATVTGGSTAFDSSMEGMSFRVNDFSKPYIIKTVDSPTQLTLRDKYEGTGASGKSYAISPVGTAMISFRSAPDDYYFVEIEALIGSDKLVSDTAYSLIPNHAPLLHGAIWLALCDLKNMNPVRIQQARADFEKTLDQLRSSFATVANLRWTSPESIAAKRMGYGTFNPLSD